MTVKSSACEGLVAGSVTQLLNTCRDDPVAWNRLWTRIQAEVSRVYARAMHRRSSADPMDDPRMIDAVAKIFLRPRIWKSRAAFFAFLLTVLQNVLRDEHRRASTVKRGGGVVHVPIMDDDLPSNHLPNSEQTDLIDTMRLLLDRLAEEHPTAHRVLERKLDRAAWADIATDLGISVEVARSQWELARAWIRREFAKIGD